MPMTRFASRPLSRFLLIALLLAALPVLAQDRSTSAISSWPTGRKWVALTYDDGPHPKVTPALLDLLARKRARATFYVVGPLVKTHPNLTRRIVEEGHELGNHTWSHPQLTKLSADKVASEMNRTQEAIREAAGVLPPTMRPPFGALNANVRAQLTRLGYQIILWDVDTNDWRKRSADQIVQTVLTGAQDGSIILFHDRLDSTLPATERIIDGLRARGFEFVTVSEMLSQPRFDSQRRPAETATEPAASESGPILRLPRR